MSSKSREETIWEHDAPPKAGAREDTIWEADAGPSSSSPSGGRRGRGKGAAHQQSSLALSDGTAGTDSEDRSGSFSLSSAAEGFSVQHEVGNILASSQILLEKRGAGYVLQHQVDMSKMSASDHKNSAQHAARMCWLLTVYMSIFNTSAPDLVAQATALLQECGAAPPYTPCRFSAIESYYESHPLAIIIKTRPESSGVARSSRVSKYLTLVAKFAELFQERADSMREELNRSLLEAINNRDVFGVRTAVSHGANVNYKPADGRTPLILAASFPQNSGILRGLLSSGADPNLGHHEGLTPLIAAVRSKNTPAVRLLVDAGAHPTMADAHGHTPLDIALEDDAPEEMLTSLFQPSDAPSVRKMAEALIRATKAGDTEKMKKLIAVGADLEFAQLEGADHLKLLGIAQRCSLLQIRAAREEIRTTQTQILELRRDVENVLHFLKVVMRSVDAIAKTQAERSSSSSASSLPSSSSASSFLPSSSSSSSSSASSSSTASSSSSASILSASRKKSGKTKKQ